MATAVVEVFFYTISLSINAVKTAGKERAMYNREIQEAIDAGESALRSLKEARESLGSARGWGLLDIFGGGTISGLVKHMKVTDARNSLDKAKADLEQFRTELADVQDIQGLDVQIGDFLTFADFFFDGFLADIMVQSKIKKGQEDIDNAIRRVEDLLIRLRTYGR